jgi:hypothetical protein
MTTAVLCFQNNKAFSSLSYLKFLCCCFSVGISKTNVKNTMVAATLAAVYSNNKAFQTVTSICFMVCAGLGVKIV